MASIEQNPLKIPPSIKISKEDVFQYLSEKIFVTTPSSYYTNYPKWPGLVGLEIEMLPLVKGDANPPQLAKRSESLENALLAAAAASAWKVHYDSQQTESTKILSIDLGEQDQITFEPGGQLEISTKPYPCLSQAAERLSFLQNLLDEYLAQADLELIQIGMNPWYSPEEIGLQIPKARYQAMTKYFAGINEGIGLRMMRQTCTVQVNLDFGPDENTLAKRYLAAQILAPLAAASFAFSPYCDRNQTPFHGMRTEVWRQIDKGRTGFPNHLMTILKNLDQKSCVQAYYEFLMASPVVFVESLHYEVPEKPINFADWLEHGYKGIFPTLNDLRTCLSLLFPEVRARGFLELRSIDCQARPWQFVPAAFYTGLLYDEQNLDHLISWADSLLKAESLQAAWANARFGLRDPGLAKLAKKAMSLAISGFERLPPCFHGHGAKESLVAFYSRFTENNCTPADALIQKCQKNGVASPSMREIRALNDEWTLQI